MLRRSCLALLPLLASLPARAQTVEFRVVYEDKDSRDHTGTVEVPTENPGITVELIGMLASRIPELKIVFGRRPWARCLLELETGLADAIFASSFRPERQKLGLYPMGADGQPDRRLRIDTRTYSLYKRSDSPLKWDGRQITPEKYEIVAMRGYAIVEDMRKLGMQVTEVDRSDIAFKMLGAGRIDGFAQLSDVADYTLKRRPELGRDIVKVIPALAAKDYYMQISHQFNARYPELPMRIWKALAELRRTEHERLTQKYLDLYAD